MAAPYDVETYLLDKANIKDTMVRMVRVIRLLGIPSALLPLSHRLFWNLEHADGSPTDAQLRQEGDLDAHRFSVCARGAARLRSVLGRIAGGLVERGVGQKARAYAR